MSSKPAIISINLVVMNGEKYIRHCLNSVKNLNYPHNQIEVNILDNNSNDKTLAIVKELKTELSDFLGYVYTGSSKNIGMWAGQEKLLKQSLGKYVVFLSADVLLDKNFLVNSIQLMEHDATIGSVQPKIYRFDLIENSPRITNLIDTCGFEIYKSRRIVNIGHGLEDGPEFNIVKEVFGTEGAVPIFRKDALEDIKIIDEIYDHDFFWYAEDLDIAWRMRMFGWKQVFMPQAIAWHDRQTTKSFSGSLIGFIHNRRNIPIKKRRLEWRNIRYAMIKNDYTTNVLRNILHIIKREIAMLGYLIIFEPSVLLEIPTLVRKLPRMLAKRKLIMRMAKSTPNDIMRWFK
jgi:GT2 family glycosyltransferase